MKVNRNDIDALNTQLSVTIEGADYQEKFEKDLAAAKQKAQLKGFRKGKTPTSVIKKMYGESIVAEAVNESLQKGLFDYIADNDINILGDPIPALDQEVINFDPNSKKDYTFKFDMGLSPDISVKGVSSSDKYEQYDVQVSDELIAEEIETARKRFGIQKPITDNIEEKDILTINSFELDSDGKKRKKDGHETSFTIMVDLMDDDIRKDVEAKKKGDKIVFDIYKVEKDRDAEYVKKYFLKFEGEEEKEVNTMFEGFIDEVSRTVPADLNQEFFDKYLGADKATNEADAKKVVGEDLKNYFDGQAKSLMYRNILEKLTEINESELPEAFLKRWLKMSNEKATVEQIEAEFGGFTKNLQWTLIKGALAKEYGIEVGQDQVRERITAQVAGYMSQYGMTGEYVDNMVNKLLQDRNQVNKVYEELLADKVFEKVGETVSVTKKKVTTEEFKDIVTAINQKLEAEKA